MIKISVVTLGCKVNQAESAAIISALNNNDNYTASEGLRPADVYILNTCSVTAEADRKSRQYLGKMRKLNDACSIIVVGCSSQNNADVFNKENVFAVGGSADKLEFALENVDKIFQSILQNRILLDKNDEKSRKNSVILTKKQQKTREFIKIQDGCDRFCTYCIIPYLRGRSVSVPVSNIVKECEKSTSKEIVLTGVDISAYGKDIGSSLVRLLSELKSLPVRKRIGSLECEVIDENLLAIMKDGNYCPHFHLSLQSGDNDVLRSMNRRYDTDLFYSKLELIRQFFPLAGITTDIIVGFPTETDDHFNNSLAFIKKCGFSDIHVFPYSSRRGTVASRKYGTLNSTTVNDRMDVLLELKHKLRAAFIEKNINMSYSVYTEDAHDGITEGYTPNYIKIYCDAPCGIMTDMKLVEPYKDGAFAVIE